MKKILILFAFILFATEAFAIPRPEYPRPQFERDEWVNLNGYWDYTLDLASTGWDRGLKDGNFSDGKIIVPFAPESELSGVGYKEFIPSIWYRRYIAIPEDWKEKEILLNFGAVYYCSEVYIDGQFVSRHFGGSDSYTLNITDYVSPGKTHCLVVNATSDLRSKQQTAGKQSLRTENFECMYTRTTGIWQTVWMEAVSPQALAKVNTITDIDRSTVCFQPTFIRPQNTNVIIRIYDNGKLIVKQQEMVSNGSSIVIPIKKAKLWAPGSPNLYDVVFDVLDENGKVVDSVKSYFGMRKIHLKGNKIYLNNQAFYQRLVLDQGFYPDGIWTAPSDEALRRDIELSMSVGFNGARLHQKVFEERFHYWADKLGYLTWGESPSWGLDCNDPVAARNFLSEWTNIVMRDINHPSIIIWTPFNEQFWPDDIQYTRFIDDVYDLTKALDYTRPVNTVSGGVVSKTDIWTVHHYEQDPQTLKDILWNEGKLFMPDNIRQYQYRGNVGFNRQVLEAPSNFPKYDFKSPYLVDEFGGIKCMEANPSEDGAWGYGSAPKTKDDFYKRLEGQVRILMELSNSIWGYCYTQLTDVQQEQNGIFYFDRRQKYDAERLKAIFGMSLPENK